MAKKLQIIVGDTPLKVDFAALRLDRRTLVGVVEGSIPDDRERERLDRLESFVGRFMEAAAKCFGDRTLVFGKEEYDVTPVVKAKLGIK